MRSHTRDELGDVECQSLTFRFSIEYHENANDSLEATRYVASFF